MPLPPVPQPPPGEPGPADQAMGRYSGARARAEDGPDQMARAAYLEAQAGGGDPLTAARDAWKSGAERLGQRLSSPDFRPEHPGDENLKASFDFALKRYRDPTAAAAMAHEFLVRQAIEQRLGALQQGGQAPQGAGVAAPPGPPAAGGGVTAPPPGDPLGRFGR